MFASPKAQLGGQTEHIIYGTAVYFITNAIPFLVWAQLGALGCSAHCYYYFEASCHSFQSYVPARGPYEYRGRLSSVAVTVTGARLILSFFGNYDLRMGFPSREVAVEGRMMCGVMIAEFYGFREC